MVALLTSGSSLFIVWSDVNVTAVPAYCAVLSSYVWYLTVLVTDNTGMLPNLQQLYILLYTVVLSKQI